MSITSYRGLECRDIQYKGKQISITSYPGYIVEISNKKVNKYPSPVIQVIL